MKFYVNYGLESEIVSASDISKVLEIADKGAAYTQRDIVITDQAGAELARRRWWGTSYNPNEATEDSPIDFGDNGFYSDWEIA